MVEKLWKIGNNSLCFLLVILIIIGNITACSRQPAQSDENDDSFVSDVFEDSNGLFSGDSFENTLVEFDDGNMDFYSDAFTDELANFIFDEYSEYVDGVYVTTLTPDEYNNALLTLESGQQVNISKIVKHLVIGGGAIILTSILLPALAPGLAPRMAIIVTNVIKEALVGAVFDGAMRGIIEYAESGDSQAAAYKAIEGGAEGFMWGAIIASGVTAFTEIKLAKQLSRVDDKLVNFSDDVAKQADDVYKNIPRDHWGPDGKGIRGNSDYMPSLDDIPRRWNYEWKAHTWKEIYEGNLKFAMTDPGIPASRRAQLIEEYGKLARGERGITFVKGEPDFSRIAYDAVTIDDFS
ncbi:MAG: hypothetical protein LBQ38_07500, partial [Spirochaetaceae bacterium]|nr:hypothetical protein [Spirochaetaceae bacterium]